MTNNKQLQPSLKNGFLNKMAESYQKQLTDEAISYLKSRGIEQETIDKFSIGFEKDQIGFQPYDHEYVGYFHNRVIFPLTTQNSEVVDFIGRSIDEKEPKYKALIGVDDVFFNEQVLQSANDVILCNSIFDVLSLDQVKLPAVCMIGNQLMEKQMEQLNGKRVFLAFGNDEIGRRETIRVAKWLENIVKELYIVHLPEGLKDINDFFIRVKNPLEEFIQLLNQTLKESMESIISPDSSYLIHFQEEYIKRNKGLLNGIKTGFEALDDLLVGGLQEGLHLLGGNVSVGKTTFLKQLADQLAEQVPVIFVSWDMTSFELWVRTMARLTGYSTQEILNGQVPVPVIQQANQRYAKIANQMWTIDANIETTLEDVALYISKISQNLHKKPVIILDHLRRIHLKQGMNLPVQESQLQIAYYLQSWSRQWSVPIILATTGKEEDLSCDLLAAVDIYLSLEGESDQIKHTLQIEVRKNRNGSLGNMELLFDRKSGNFSKKSENTD